MLSQDHKQQSSKIYILKEKLWQGIFTDQQSTDFIEIIIDLKKKN